MPKDAVKNNQNYVVKVCQNVAPPLLAISSLVYRVIQQVPDLSSVDFDLDDPIIFLS